MRTNVSRYWQIYRPDCQRLLADGARNAGAAIEYSSQITKVDAEQGTVYLANGMEMVADIVVGADGAVLFSSLFSLLMVQRHPIEDASIYRWQRERRTNPIGRI
jgi:2-polyprenyl-6-methoxyphenol hydroxylase-like FAD-dependent oxidoreductase